MKILVVHPAQQHSYRLASALSQKGWLYKYITTVYWKKNSFTYLASVCLKGDFKKKAESRFCPEISSKSVVQFCEIEGLLKLLTMNTACLRPYYKRIKYHTSDRFSKKVVSYAIKHQVDAVVCYDDCSSLLFEELAKKAPDILRIMDVSAANILYMRQIYDQDSVLQPEFSERLHREREIVWNPGNINRATKELNYGQIFLVPSHFVAKSLMFSGISDSQIKICPYGVDTSLFFQKKYRSFEECPICPIRFIYVGGVKELKGIAYLLNAIKQVPQFQASLTIIGQYNPSDPDIKPYRERVHFTGPLLHEEVSKYLVESDVFIFPSLGEGLSLATLEAASCGLPLIVTENSGVNDAMTNGKEGFIVPIQSTESLVEKIHWFIKNPEQIEIMGRAAREMALHYTWNAYYQRIGEIFEEIERTKDA